MRELIQQVEQVFGEIDIATSDYARTTGLNCPSGCGQCCENPDVETTVLECLPLAFWLLNQPDGGDAALIQLQETRSLRLGCHFYLPTPGAPGQGRCTVYDKRMGLCRLFGFAARLDRRRRNEPVICRVHRQTCPDGVAKAYELAEEGAEMANFYDFATQFALLEPQLGTEQLPINQAIRIAMEKVGLWMSLEAQLQPLAVLEPPAIVEATVAFA